jgi:hypothetical protein
MTSSGATDESRAQDLFWTAFGRRRRPTHTHPCPLASSIRTVPPSTYAPAHPRDPSVRIVSVAWCQGSGPMCGGYAGSPIRPRACTALLQQLSSLCLLTLFGQIALKVPTGTNFVLSEVRMLLFIGTRYSSWELM